MSTKKQKKIFISWSGEKSKIIANKLKNILEKNIFEGTGLTCFVSDVDISSGTDWWNKINRELKSSRMGILCITKENITAPWIYYEAGALTARDLPTIPLLISCDIASLKGTPLQGKQCVDFYDQQKYINMIKDINKKMSLLNIPEETLKLSAVNSYNILKKDAESILTDLKNMRIFNTKYVFPSLITTINVNTVFISAPMASISNDYYYVLREYALSLKSTLKNIGFTDIICPIIDNDDPKKFDGKTRAIKNNFNNLKQIECMVIVYPENVPSSSLVEIGYGIALCKRMVIFYKEKLPYILEEAGENIEHVKTYKFDDFSEIDNIITSNGMSLFEGDNND